MCEKRKAQMNKSLKVLLLTTTVLKCSEIFASDEVIAVVDQDKNASHALVPLQSAEVVIANHPTSLEEIRRKRAGLSQNMTIVQSRVGTIDAVMGSKNKLISEVSGAIQEYITTLNRTYELSAQVERLTSTLFARLNCDADQVRKFVQIVTTETNTTLQKEESLKAVLAGLDEGAINELLGRLKDSQDTIKLIADEFASRSQSPARSNRASSVGQNQNQFSPGGEVDASPNGGSVHQAEDGVEDDIADDGEGNRKHLTALSDSDEE